MNGCRRPQGLRKLSDSCPISGSMQASKISAISAASPTAWAGKPITWL
jgi:hypothetical protein